jgi:hypothetical protein
MRHPVVLTSVEEDFRAIGLLPALNESDDPKEPRDIPSPDPSTLDGLDDSEGDKEAETPTARQPKPKMGPDDDDAEESGYDPDEAGGTQQKAKGDYKKVPHGKEASMESRMYRKSDKQPMMGNKKNRGDKVQMAKGLNPTKKIGGMKESTTLNKANQLLEEVSGLIKGVQTDEAVDEMLRSFKLVAENAALLSDRLTEISDQYEVEDITSEMEDLSRDAVEMIDIIESELEMSNVGDCEDDDSVEHSSNVHEDGKPKADHNPNEPYDIPSPAFKEQTETVLNAMVGKLMDSLESYDSALVEMGMSGDMDEDDGDDGVHVHADKVHLHTKKVHVHHGADSDDDQEPDGDEDGPDSDDDHDGYTAAGHDGGDEEGDEPSDYDSDEDDGDEETPDDSDDSDHDSSSLMARMRALKARKAAMHGGRHGEEDDESY